MHIHYLDPYRAGDSLVHQLDGRVKLALTLAFILAIALAQPGAWPAYILFLGVILAIEVLSQLGIGYVLSRAALAAPFVLAALPLIFTTPGSVLFSLGPLTATLPGLERFASIALKSWISVQAAVVLTASTPFPDLLDALRALRLPRLLVSMVGLMWRYLFILADEAVRMARARAARSGVPMQAHMRADLHPGGTLPWRARVTGGMAGSLFVRSVERSERIYAAMLSRGYDGDVHAQADAPLTPGKRHLLIIGLGVCFLFVLLGQLWGG